MNLHKRKKVGKSRDFIRLGAKAPKRDGNIIGRCPHLFSAGYSLRLAGEAEAASVCPWAKLGRRKVETLPIHNMQAMSSRQACTWG